MREIRIVNQSTVVPAPQAVKAVAAMQLAMDTLFTPAWGVSAQLTLATSPLSGAEQLFLLDTTDQADALGYHTLLEDSYRPVGFAFAKTALDNGTTWQEVLSHELWEQSVNPWLVAVALSTWKGRTAILAMEVSDPVEADDLHIDGVPISDFVTPDYFRPDPRAGAVYDVQKLLTAPDTLRPGGYQSYTTDLTNWQEEMAAKSALRPYRRLVRSSVYSRHLRFQNKHGIMIRAEH